MTHSTQTWHADRDLLEAYVAGDVDAISGASVEQHLARCAECRATIATLVEVRPLELAWLGVRDAVESPEQPFLIRIARRCGLSEPTSVLLAATASLRTSWLVAAFVALTFATGAAAYSSGQLLAPFLLIAPLVPVIGVAAAYGSEQDPLEALVVTAPYGRTRLILTRTLAVLATVLPLTALLGLMLPGPLWIAGAWLGPALALVPIMLAVSSFVGPRTGSAVVAFGWCAVVVFSIRGLPATWPVEPSQQLVYLALAAVACAVLLVRSRNDRKIGAVL